MSEVQQSAQHQHPTPTRNLSGETLSRASESPTGAPPAPLPEKASKLGVRVNKRAIPGVTEIIAVASGKGGVGKSTVSVNLAVALARTGAKVGLLDGDIYGPSAPMMLGLQGSLQVGAYGRILPKEAHGIRVMSFGFFSDAKEPVIWRGPMIAKAFRQFCYDVDWGECDYLIIDLPPGTGDIQLSMIENLPVHGAIVVTTPQDVALIDAHKAISMFKTLEVKILGVVENMAFYQCPRCGHCEDVFGEGGGRKMAEDRHLDLLVSIPIEKQIRMQGDQGLPLQHEPSRVAFMNLAQEVRARLGVLHR